MQSRKGCWRTPLLVLTVALIVVAPLVAMADSNRTVLRQQQPKDTEDGPGLRPAFAPPEIVAPKKPTLYPRTETFWAFESGPDYGFVSVDLATSPDVLFSRVGSFITKGPGLSIPSALRATEAASRSAYYLVQFTPQAFAPDEIDRSLQALAAQGATLIEYVPNNGYIIRVDPASYTSVAGSRLLQFMSPYHPAYKIARDMGTAPLPDPEAAASPVYSIVVSGFRGTMAADVAAQVTALGGSVRVTEDSENGPVVIADLHKDKIVTLAGVEGIKSIDENLPRFAYGEESSWNVVAGTYIIGSKPPLYLAGVTGDGRFKLDVDNAPTGTGDPRPTGAGDVDWNGNGVIDNGAQIIADTDTGMAVDGGDFAETAFASGWTGAGANVRRRTDGLASPANHRKIAWYEIAPGGFGTGDTASCDPAPSHGTVTSGQAAGNASSGPFTADNLDWTGDGVVDNYGDPNTGDLCGPGFCFPPGATTGVTYRVDGVAPGARLIFQDVNNQCPEPTSFSFGTYAILLGSARTKGARLHTYSFGAFNEVTGTAYDASASAIDAFLSTDSNRDYMMFIAAGNNGSATANVAPSGKSNTLSNEASSKNALVIGANTSGNAAALQNRAGFSSIGPAPNGLACTPQSSASDPADSNCGRIKPDLMAPGQDGNTGLAESYNCVSSDTNQTGTVECLNLGGNAGTSFSTPNAAGAGALVRDYFVQGLYPDGTSGNAANDSDRQPRMSGALVKALLVASANDMNGANLTNPTPPGPGYVHRFNPETGYGFINLRRVLPLTTDPLTPSGIIVHDGGCPTGVTCPSNLSLTTPLPLAGTTSAEFEVLDRRQELRVALAWVDEVAGSAVGVDLNLELRYCGTDCTTNAGDIVWYGNVFTEDRNDDGTEDQNLDGTAGLLAQGVTGHWRSEGSWSLSNRGDPGAFVQEAARDTQNNVEAIFLSHDPEGDGTDAAHDSDSQVRTGKWRVLINHATGAPTQKYALVIAGGVTVDSSIRLDTNPISCNGEVGVIVNEVAKLATIDPGCTTASCTEATIEGRTSIKVTASGGAQADSETASAAKVRFNLTKDPNSFSFVSGKIPVSTAAAINIDDDILVAGDGYTVTATYVDRDCSADGTASCVGGAGENVIKTSQATFDCTPNVDFFAIGQPGRNAVFLLAGGCDADKFFDNHEVFTYLVQFANLEDALTLDDITVTLRAVQPDGDDETDPGRLNNAPSPYMTVQSGTQFIDMVFPGFLESAGFTVAVTSAAPWTGTTDPPPEVEMVVGITSNKAGKSSPSYGVFSHLLNADEEKFLYSTDYPGGATVDRDINSNEKIENPIRDRLQPFPKGNQRDNFDGLNETITFASMTTTSFGGGNPGFNGPWDFDTNDEGFRSGKYVGSDFLGFEISNWGEDQDYDGLVGGPYLCAANPSQGCSCAGNPAAGCDNETPACPADPGEDCVRTEDFQGDQDGTLDQGYSLTGGCGYLSSGGAGARGIWHTGSIGNIGATSCSSNSFPGPATVACENIDIIDTTAGTNLWLEFLRTPVIQKVRKNPDARNLSYRVELIDWRWNLNADYEADNVGFTWEFDEDTASLDPVDLGDGLILRQHDDGMGPINGANVNLTRGFPMFAENDPDDDTAGFGARQGTAGRNRAADRSCVFSNLSASQVSVTSRLLREPKPVDDDCDNDIQGVCVGGGTPGANCVTNATCSGGYCSLNGPDGCPGYCGVDDDGDLVADNAEEACPCFAKQDGIDDDGDGRTDENDELQRFYRCSTATTQFCNNLSPAGTDDCPGAETCGRFGDGKPKPYGDDVCGDGTVDEGVSAKWASETTLGENGNRIAQNQNWNIGTLNGPFLRFATLEDTYDAEAGNTFQAAIGFVVFEGTTGNVPVTSYGLGIDDMTVEWAESHPVVQPGTAGCGTKTCASGDRAGKLCFNQDDCGGANVCSGGASTGSSCGALTWGTTNLFSGSGVVSLNLVDFNADQTQGTFQCSAHGFPAAVNNDCDADGLKEVQVEVKTPAEANAELIRLEQTSSGSAAYSGLVSISSAINAAGDKVAFIQYNGTLTPSVTALYFDLDSGAGDLNADGTLDGPPSNGKDGCPGFCGVDDDQDAGGPDKRAGAANLDDDGNGICDYKSGNIGAQCTTNASCTTSGNCLNVDEPDELCGRVCTAGTTSGHCSTTGAACNVVGGAPCAGSCVADNCISNAACGTGGNCPGNCIVGGVVGAACTSSSTCAGGYCAGTQRGDDICANVDETNERCAVVAGKLAASIDDNCGCVSNPVTAVLNAVFDVADVIVQSYTFVDTPPNGTGDNDGFADDNELVSLTLVLRNLSSFDVEGVEARITTQDSTIQCINDPAAKYGQINTLASATNLDPIKFTVGSIGRTSLAQIKQATFTVTVTGTAILDSGAKVPFDGTATPQKFTVDLDLDVNGAAPAAAKATKVFSFESTQYGSAGAWSTDWAHTFFENQSGLHCQYNNPGIPGTRSAPVGCFLRQDVDTAVPDDWHLHSTVVGTLPDGGRDSGAPGACSGGANPNATCQQTTDCLGKCAGGAVPGEFCTSGTGQCLGKCSLNPTLRCSITPQCQAAGAGVCSASGTCTSPSPGPCVGLGNSSMHMGLHEGATVQDDTIHLNNIFYAYYKPSVMVGLGRPGTDDRPVLDFWQQMSETDDRIFSNLGPPYSLGACTVQALYDRDSDGTLEVGPPTDTAKDGWWEKLVPFYGVPAQQRFPAGNCTYDPNDDGNNENDQLESGSPTFLFNTAGTILGPSSTCYPEFIWACAGDTQDPPYDPNLGQVEPSFACFTEVDGAGAPVTREGPGPGRWIESKFDLYKYRGRQLWIRYLVSDVQFGFDTWSTGFTGGFGGNRDDGWYIDDLKITGANGCTAGSASGHCSNNSTNAGTVCTAPGATGSCTGGGTCISDFCNVAADCGTGGACPRFTLKEDTDTPPASGCPASNCTAGNLLPRFTGSTFITRTNNSDDDADSTTDEADEGKFTQVNSDAPLRNVVLNGADTAGPTTSDCLNGVLQYRFWEDTDNDSTLDAGELIRDYSENPRATASPLKNAVGVSSPLGVFIHMNVKCSAPLPNTCTGTADATLRVTLPGTATGSQVGALSTLVFDQAISPAGKNKLEWAPLTPNAKYDVATKQGISANPVAAASWLNAGGYFDTMVCGGAGGAGAGNAISCTDADADGLCEFTMTGGDATAPAVNTLDLWLIRETQGSWNELGGTSLGATTRDTNMNDGAGVCSNTTFAP